VVPGRDERLEFGISDSGIGIRPLITALVHVTTCPTTDRRVPGTHQPRLVMALPSSTNTVMDPFGTTPAAGSFIRHTRVYSCGTRWIPRHENTSRGHRTESPSKRQETACARVVFAKLAGCPQPFVPRSPLRLPSPRGFQAQRGTCVCLRLRRQGFLYQVFAFSFFLHS